MEMYWMYIFSKTMFSSSLPPVVCRRAHLIYAILICLFAHSGDKHTLCCVFAFFFPCLVAGFFRLSIFDCPLSYSMEQ